MARNLLRSGHSVQVYNRTRAKAEELADLGGVAVDSPAEAAAGADVIITMLSDGAALLETAEGPQGFINHVTKDCVVIDCSTVDPPTSLRISSQLNERGAYMLDAPVFGSKNESESAKLGFIVGGAPEIFDRMKPIFLAMGTPHYVGLNGMGAYLKLVVNLIIAGTVQLWNEGMVLATKAGIDPQIVHDIIMSSRARSGILEMKADNVMKRDFTPFFALKLMEKDLGLVVNTARAIDIPMPVANSVRDIFAKCLASGLGDEDFSASIKYLEQLTNVTVASTNGSSRKN